MKFGKRLEAEVFHDWKYYAFDYKAFKNRIKGEDPYKAKGAGDEEASLKSKADDSPAQSEVEEGKGGAVEDTASAEGSSSFVFGDEDEEAFVEALDKEIEKISTFCKLKHKELNRRVDNVENTIVSIQRQPPRSAAERPEAREAEEHGDDNDNSVMDQEEGAKNRLEQVTRTIKETTREVQELASFVVLNHTAVRKILKKHDKMTRYKLSTDYMLILSHKHFVQETYDTLILKLSNLWDAVRSLHGGGTDPSKGPGVDSQNIMRKTTKYWVHPDNVVELKLFVLKHLPVLLFKKGVPNDPALNSIYFDNDELFLYHSRMARDQGAQNLRFRWYGKRDDAKEVWVERKTHKEDWTGEKSVKERFPIKEKYLNDYLAGKYNIRQTTNKLRAEGKKKLKDIEDMEQLGDEVQQLVLSRKLRPMVRTSYNRTAFQLPADARVRISLDTELCMVREDYPRCGDNWRRNDEHGYPFSTIPAADVIKFPYAVLEIKLQTQFGQAAPKWATELANSHLVEAVPKFSKFHHGVSMFHSEKVKVVPFWFYQMNRNILKPRLAPLPSADMDDVDIGGGVGGGDEEVDVDRNGKPTVKVDKLGKLYFSNERTFLRWLTYSIQFILLSILLVNFSPDRTPQLVGVGLTAIGFLILFWNLAQFHIRAYKIRHDDGTGPFELKMQPVVVVIIMLSGIVVGGIVSWTSRRNL
ncbi:vacuolar transporter chaperone [Irineochytrium annulatum]|nr:vacuolar transporter chaperone [Irineochytrium annulatum]